MKKFILKLVQPRSKSEDDKRREFILNVILVSSLLLSGSVALLTLLRSVKLHSFEKADAASALTELFIFLIFLFLYILSRCKLAKIASYILLLLYFLPVTQALYAWGPDLPQGTLVYALIIIVAGILIGSNFAFIVTAICSAVIIYFNVLIQKGILSPNSVWKKEEFGWPDVIVFSITFFVIAVISWLSNREIEKSLKRARKSEADLKKERDSLEITVEKRTQEIKQIQLEKMEQLSHFAEIGQLASGLFHDLVNPLTAVSLNLDKMKSNSKDLAWPQDNLSQAIKSTKHIEKLMASIKNQINLQEIKQKFDLVKVTKEAVSLLSYKARISKVQIKIIDNHTPVTVYGNPLKFHQSITNIVSNAIDAYDDVKLPNKVIELRFMTKNQFALIDIQDWGEGISGEFQKVIFDPFFTTKSLKEGIGLGLAITKNIVEKDFRGVITVQSQKGEGTTFSISIPLKHELEK